MQLMQQYVQKSSKTNFPLRSVLAQRATVQPIQLGWETPARRFAPERDVFELQPRLPPNPGPMRRQIKQESTARRK